MIVSKNEDKPLVLGRLTTAIGEADVNIANMTLGRDAPNGRATTLINLDGPLPEDALTRIQAIEHIREVRQLNL